MFKTHEIVSLLLKNHVLIEKWKQFVGELDIKSEFIVQWGKSFNNETRTPYELFTDILNHWLAEQGVNNGTLDKLCTALNKVDTPFIYQICENGLTVVPKKAMVVIKNDSIFLVFGVTAPIRNFVGRQTELSKLEKTFKDNTHKLTLVSGYGGIGKTELVKQFALKACKNNHVTWLNGDTTNSLVTSAKSLAAFLKIPLPADFRNSPAKSDACNILEIISKRINDNRWLIIIDNADKPREDFVEVIKFCAKLLNTFILVTSQLRTLLDENAELIEIVELLPADALQLVKSSLNDDDDDDLRTLCNKLQNFPLALQQAIAFIIQQKRHSLQGKAFGIKEYLKIFASESMKLFEIEPNISNEYSKTMHITWKLTMGKLQEYGNDGLQAIKILFILAFVDPDGIDLDFLKILQADCKTFKTLQLTVKNLGNFHTCMQLLKSYSVIKIEDSFVTVHRLLLKLTRCHLTEEGRDKILYLLNRDLDIVSLQRKNVPHVLRIWKRICKRCELYRELCECPRRICYRLMDISCYTEALQFSQSNYDLARTLFGEEDERTLRLEKYVAVATAYMGNYMEAFEKYQLLLQKYIKVFGYEHEDTWDCWNSIALVLQRLHRFSESQKFHNLFLKAKEKVLGKDHRDIIKSKHGIALALNDQGKPLEAMKIYKEVLEWDIKVLGEGHSSTLTTKHNIGCCLFQQNKYEEALSEFQNTFQLKMKYLGEEHADTIDTKYWLALTYHAMGDRQKSLQTFEYILVPQLKVLGEQHPHVNHTRICIANLKSLLDDNKPTENP